MQIGAVVDEYFDDDARRLDFVVRSLARHATISMEELAGAEPTIATAFVELEPGLEGKPLTVILAGSKADLHRVGEALRKAGQPEQQRLYAESDRKLGAGRTYSATVVTLAVSAALIILALRLGAIEVGKDGKGIVIRMNRNDEPLSGSVKAVAELVARLFGGGTFTDTTDRGDNR